MKLLIISIIGIILSFNIVLAHEWNNEEIIINDEGEEEIILTPIIHSHGHGDYRKVVQPWGITTLQAEEQKLILKPGEGDCPAWYPMNCVQVNKIPNYLEKMVNWYHSKNGI